MDEAERQRRRGRPGQRLHPASIDVREKKIFTPELTLTAPEEWALEERQS